jgi:hypothetical protein
MKVQYISAGMTVRFCAKIEALQQTSFNVQLTCHESANL